MNMDETLSHGSSRTMGKAETKPWAEREQRFLLEWQEQRDMGQGNFPVGGAGP